MSFASSRLVVSTALIGMVIGGFAETTPAEVVRFTTHEGIEIVGDFEHPGGNDAVSTSRPVAPVVILLHMYRSNRSAFRPLTSELNRAGFATLAIDLRGHGDSGGKLRDTLARSVEQRDSRVFNAMDGDVRAAYEFLAERKDIDISRLAIVGASVGCSIAMKYAVDDASVDAIVCLSPGLDYLGVDSREPAQKLKGRAIWLLATEDERQAVDELAKLNPGVAHDILGPGRIHGTTMFGQITGIEGRIVDFLKRHIGAPASAPVYTTLGATEYYATADLAIAAAKTDRRMLRVLSSDGEARARGLQRHK